MNLYQEGTPSGEDRESPKAARSEERQKKQRFEPEWATNNNGLSMQVDGELAKRKWEPDESDAEKETMDEEGNSGDVDDACDENTALGIPKFQLTPLPSLHAKKKQKKYSAAEMKRSDAATSVFPPSPISAKKSKGGLSKAPKGKVKEEEEEEEEEEEDGYEDLSFRSRGGTRDEPEDKKGRGYIKEEQEADEDPQEKEKKKKSKPAGIKTKRVAKQPAKRARKDFSNDAEDGSSPSSSTVAAGKKVGESGGQKSTAMTKAEMEIAFDIATEKMEWVILASTLNEKSGGAKHNSSNLKRHWVSVLRKRVINGYID